MSCIACGRFLHEECGVPCCCALPIVDSRDMFNREDLDVEPKKEEKEVGVSAGRKRAALLHEIDPDRACEWRWQANCGGGLKPIIGCLSGKQQNRHHGPVKNTSRNESGNVHLICARCHNRWHAANDDTYDEEKYSKLPHKSRPATPDEMLLAGKV